MVFLNLPDSIGDKIKFVVRHSRVERQPYPSRFVRKIAKIDLLRDLVRLIMAHIEQKVAVSSGTSAPATNLNSEFIVQQFYG
jgi:hypothetical protein